MRLDIEQMLKLLSKERPGSFLEGPSFYLFIYFVICHDNDQT